MILIPFQNDIEVVKNQIIENFRPQEIILFGSCAKGIAKETSDIDICIILNFDNKRQMRRLLDESIESSKDIDFIIYTPSEWDKYKSDTTTFANLIYRTGVKIYG
jgi:predicted nucleotidyltransferase